MSTRAAQLVTFVDGIGDVLYLYQECYGVLAGGGGGALTVRTRGMETALVCRLTALLTNSLKLGIVTKYINGLAAKFT